MNRRNTRDVPAALRAALRARLEEEDPAAFAEARTLSGLLHEDIMCGPLRPGGDDGDGGTVPDDYDAGLYALRLVQIVDDLPGWYDADAGHLLAHEPDAWEQVECPDCDGTGCCGEDVPCDDGTVEICCVDCPVCEGTGELAQEVDLSEVYEVSEEDKIAAFTGARVAGYVSDLAAGENGSTTRRLTFAAFKRHAAQ